MQLSGLGEGAGLEFATEFVNFAAVVAPGQNLVTALHCSAVHSKIESEITAAGDPHQTDIFAQLASGQMRLAKAFAESEAQ